MQGASLLVRAGLIGALLFLPVFGWLMPGMLVSLLPLFGLVAVAVIGWEFSSLALVGMVALIAVSPEQHVGEAGATVLALHKAGLIAISAVLVVQRGFSGQFNGPTFAFLGAGALSVCFGQIHPELGPRDMFRAVLGSIAPFVFIWVRQERKWQPWLILAAAAAPLISVAAGVPLLAVGHPLFGMDQNGVVRFQGAGIPAFLAYLGEIGTYAAFAEYVLTGDVRWLGLAAGAFGCILASGTRMPMVTATLFCLILLLFARGQKFTAGPRLRLWMLGLAVVAIGGVLLGPNLVARTFGSGAASGSVNLSGRDVIWPLFTAAIERHPFFGQGIGTYRVLIDPDDVKYIGTLAAHNEYLRLSADIGIVGVVLLVLGHVAWFRHEWRHLLQPERVVLLAFGVAFALHSLTDNTLIAPQAVILYAWLATFLQRARARAEHAGRLPRRRAPLVRGAPKPSLRAPVSPMVALAVLAALPAAAQEPAAWARFATPAPGPAQVFGAATNGCIQGAVRLPAEGPGFRAVRLSRNRHWGHPATVSLAATLSAAALREGLETLYIGDLSQPRGGPLPYGHASHQTGLDLDVWFNLLPKPAQESAAQREDIRIVSLVRPGPPPRIDPAAFTPAHVTLLRLAATQKAVDRVLVHPAIKQHLCTTLGADRGWIRKLRPWWGHDDHMHLRLACPPDSPQCIDPPPIPAGDGCDATLAWWFDQPPVPPAPARPSGPRALPAACDGLRRLP